MAKKANKEVLENLEEVLLESQETTLEEVIVVEEAATEEPSVVEELVVENEIIEEAKEKLPKKSSKTADNPRALAQQQAKQAHIDFQEAELKAISTAQMAADLKKQAELEAINAQEAIERTLTEAKRAAEIEATNAMVEVLKTKKEMLANAEEVRRESLRLEEIRQKKQHLAKVAREISNPKNWF